MGGLAGGMPFTGGEGRRPADFAVRRGPQRSRRAVLVRAAAGLVTLLALAGVVRWALTSPVFAVQRVESGAYRFTPAAELEAAFARHLGTNIWTLRPGAMAADLEALPWVRDARVVRRLPDRLNVEFTEWTPLLAFEPVQDGAALRDRLVLLEDGRVLDFPAHLVLPGLPVLVGVPPVRAGDGPDFSLPAAATAAIVELVFAMEDAGLEAAAAVDFVVARSDRYAIVLQDGQGTLLVGRKEFGPRLQRWMSARDHLEPGLVYDLRFENRITVRAQP